MTTIVVNKYKESYEVYIGRGSKWGNPFVIGKDGNRDDVCDKYEAYLLSNQTLLDALPELKDKKLGCFCKPQRCHGDLLAKLADGL